jgi:hypothetical protein
MGHKSEQVNCLYRTDRQCIEVMVHKLVDLVARHGGKILTML